MLLFGRQLAIQQCWGVPHRVTEWRNASLQVPIVCDANVFDDHGNMAAWYLYGNSEFIYCSEENCYNRFSAR